MSFGFRTTTDNGETQIDGEHIALNLVFSTTWQSPSIPSDPGDSQGRGEAGYCWYGLITAIPEQYLTDQHVFVTRCTSAHVAAYRATYFSGLMRLQMYVHPIGVSNSSHFVEIYVFKAEVSGSQGFGIQVFNESSALVYDGADYPLWVTAVTAFADQSSPVPSGVVKAAVSANRLVLMNGGDYGEGFVFAPMTFRCTPSEVKSSRMIYINSSGGVFTGQYTVVDVSNCPLPFSKS